MSSALPVREFKGLRKALLTFQLTLPRAAVGMLAAILSSNFNRITILALGVTAVVVTTMLGCYQFMSPFQVIFGRMADRFPVFGYRRSPYIIGGLVVSAIAIALLPVAANAMGAGHIGGFVAGFSLLFVFGVGFCMIGVTHLSLIADVVPEKERGLQMALTWIMLIVSMIVSLRVLGKVMPEYDYSVMREAYAMTIPIAFVLALLGVLGVEKRMTKPQIQHLTQIAEDEAGPQTGFVKATIDFLKQAAGQKDTQNFFLFIFFAMFGIYLQDNILEVFGAEVMGLTVGETGKFQQIWGMGSLAGMLLMGLLTRFASVSKRFAIISGMFGVIASFLVLAYASATVSSSWVLASLFAFGFFNGFFVVGTLSAMLDMTTEKDRGGYMGLWGLALAYAMGLGSIVGGALVSGIIETEILRAEIGYMGIFILEAVLVLIGMRFVLKVNSDRFSQLDAKSLAAAMEADQ